jgi:alkylmercury lyase
MDTCEGSANALGGYAAVDRRAFNVMVQALADALCANDAQICLHLVRLLAEGHPIPRERLAAALDVPADEVEALLARVPDAVFDHQGNVIAYGLSLTPTSHRFRVNGRDLYTWCALDALMYPVALGQRAEVTSRCPVSTATVRLTITPETIERVDPATVVVSIVIPVSAAAGCNVRDAFCRHVHFLRGPEEATAWQTAHPEAQLLPVHDAHALARLLAQRRYRAAS